MSESNSEPLLSPEPSPKSAENAPGAQVLKLTQPVRRAATLASVAAPSFVGLVAAEPVEQDGRSGAVTLRVGSTEVTARLLPAVEPVVVRRAIERGEVVIAQQNPDGWVVVGVLRTCATPGIDVGDDYVIEARRVSVRAEHELSLVSGAARIAVAAIGRIETVAKNITSRASAVQKIIGRAIQLN